MCWPPSCFPTGSGISYITPNTAGNPAPIIVNGSQLTTNGETAELKPRITIDQSTATSALYRFYVTTTNGAFLDSIDLSINFTLGIQSIKQAPVITLAPNPATENITVSTGIIDNATVQIMDVLGNIIYRDVITNGSKLIDVSDFKNGVYFVVIDPVGMTSNFSTGESPSFMTDPFPKVLSNFSIVNWSAFNFSAFCSFDFDISFVFIELVDSVINFYKCKSVST